MFVPFIILLRELRGEVCEGLPELIRRDDFQLCERTVRSRVALRKEGQVELSGGDA